MIADANRTSIPTRLRFMLLNLVVAGALAASVGTTSSTLSGQGSSDEDVSTCNYVVLLLQRFDDVTPPALPLGWSSTTWVTSHDGFPNPPFCSYPNAAFADSRTSNSDKRLLSPNISLIEGGEQLQVSFCNIFDTQDGFDGGVLEVSFDNGLTFQDVMAAGGTFVNGGYTGTISSCCGNPLAGRQAWTGNSRGSMPAVLNLRIPASNMIMLRWRMGTGTGVTESQGWRIDDVLLTQCGQPTPTPTATVPLPPPRPRPTPAPRPTP